MNTEEKTEVQNTLSESSHYQSKQQSGNTQLVEVKPIKETPFTACKFDNHWFLAFGKYRLSHNLETEEECIQAAMDTSWTRLLTIIQIMIDENEAKKAN